MCIKDSENCMTKVKFSSKFSRKFDLLLLLHVLLLYPLVQLNTYSDLKILLNPFDPFILNLARKAQIIYLC